MSKIRKKILIAAQSMDKLIYTECTNATSYISLPYNQKDFRIKVKFEFVKFARHRNDDILTCWGANICTFAYKSSDTLYEREKALYYSTKTLLENVSASKFFKVEFGKIYEEELSYINDVITNYRDHDFIYSYSDSRYVIRPLVMFNHNYLYDEGSYSRIYECQLYTSNDDNSIVYDLIPYEDPITHYGGFKDKLTGNTYTTSRLIVGCK